MNGDIFLVDDNGTNLALLSRVLREAGFQVRASDRGHRALQMIQARHPELVLLDIKMPDMTGYEVCHALKSDPATQDIPVLFISANDDPLDKVKAFGLGGVDYIPKPFQVEEVIARVSTHLSIGRLRKVLEERNDRLQVALHELAEASLTDPLTGLRNRRFLIQRMDAAAAAGASLSGSPQLALVLIDIDHFKRVNDLHGHSAGDIVLVEVGRRLKGLLLADDYLVRWGGEEFLAVARCEGRTTAEDLAERVRARIGEEPFAIGDDLRLEVTCSVGVAALPFPATPDRGLPWQDVLKLADRALYAVKRSGRNGWAVISPGKAPTEPESRDRIVMRTGEAVARGELSISTSLQHEDIANALG